MPIHIILDSTFFRGNANFETQKFASLSLLANDAGGKIYVPEPVVVEVVEGHRERVRNARQKEVPYVRAMRELNQEVKLADLDESTLLSGYEAAFRGFLKKNHVELLGFPSTMPDSRTLFESAAKKIPPFDSNGGSFKDAVIAYVVKEAKDKFGEQVLFVTDDAAASDRLRALLKDELVVSMNSADAEQELFGRIKSDLLRRIEEKAMAIDEFLNKNLDAIGAYIKANATFPDVSSSDDEVVSIDDYHAKGMLSVDEITFQNGRVQYSANIGGYLTVTTKGYPATTMLLALGRRLMRPRKIGDKAQPDESNFQYFTDKVTRQTPFPIRTKIRCESKVDAANAIEDYRIIEVTESRQLGSDPIFKTKSGRSELKSEPESGT